VVLTERSSGVLIVTINRPHARNAINLATAQALGAAMDELDSDGSLSAGVLTGAGGNFCAGMDLKAFLAGERPSLPRQGFAGIVEQPPRKPLIAAVEGYALAGGFEIALACDIIVAANDARFGLPEARRGLVAAGGGLMRLSEHVPYHIAVEWALTGDQISVGQAAAAGLVNRVTEPGTSLREACRLAGRIAENGPLAVRATKEILVNSRDWKLSERFALQRELTEPVRSSEDAREGARAFTEKRHPAWQGR
jgi:enoyl-CoA hydratase